MTRPRPIAIPRRAALAALAAVGSAIGLFTRRRPPAPKSGSASAALPRWIGHQTRNR